MTEAEIKDRAVAIAINLAIGDRDILATVQAIVTLVAEAVGAAVEQEQHK